MLFKDFVQINPKVDLEKGETYPYVGMADVNPSRGYVTNSETREYKNSRSRFKEGDTLFARITPCLENGKITRFKSDGIKKGFGSTEFFVFRAKEEVSDPNYVYYLSRSPLIRKTAEKSMAGASGRQRADISAIEEVEITPPDLPTQQKIAYILSAFDDLIENNTRRIAILEEMARRIYREWFVHFRYPGHEEDRLVDSGTELGEIPEGWEVKQVDNIVNRLSKGNIYRKKNTDDDGDIIIVDQSTDEYLGFHDNEPDFSASSDEPFIIFGDHTCKMQLLLRPFSLGPNVVPFIAEDEELSNYYLYYLLEPIIESREYKRHWTTFKVKKVAVASIELAKRFEEKVRPLIEQKENLKKQINKLKETRDLLLPKLISGKIDVENWH